MAERKETILELPWEIADSCNGFGMDFGKKCYISDVPALVSYCIHCNIFLSLDLDRFVVHVQVWLNICTCSYSISPFISGGSVVKVVYLHVDDWEEPDKRTKVSSYICRVNCRPGIVVKMRLKRF